MIGYRVIIDGCEFVVVPGPNSSDDIVNKNIADAWKKSSGDFQEFIDVLYREYGYEIYDVGGVIKLS